VSSAASDPAEERRPPWAEFRAALDAAGFRPSRRLGQNFLLDDNAARAIARDARVGPGDFVLEVGPGCGFLSVHLARAGVELVGVEVDPRLAAIASAFLAPYPRARVILGDALAGKHELGPELRVALPASGAWHVVSNLPYSITGPLLASLAARVPEADSLTVLVQREVAARLAATPGSAEWGPLSVALQSAYAVRAERVLPANLFWPRPKVESQVVRLELRADRAGAAERGRVVTLAGRLLRHRRQSLGRVLRELLGDPELARAVLIEGGWPPELRAESLGLADLARLAAGPAGGALRGGSAGT